MSFFALLLILVLILLVLFLFAPLLRQLGHISRIRQEYHRHRERTEAEAARRERASKSSAEILRESQQDLEGGEYVDFEEVEKEDR